MRNCAMTARDYFFKQKNENPFISRELYSQFLSNMGLTHQQHRSRFRRPMKMYAQNLLNSNARERAINAQPAAANNCVFFDRDLVGSNDHGVARPEKSEGPGNVNGDFY